MVERASDSDDNVLLINSLCSADKIAEPFLSAAQIQYGLRVQAVAEKINELLHQTLERSQHMLNMIQHFRSLEIASRGYHSSLGRGSVIYDSVFQVLRAMQYEFPMEKITILKILPGDLPTPAISRLCLEIVLFQLIYNAREVVGDVPGIITIEASEKHSLSAVGTAGIFTLRVSDTGPELPEDYLEHIFDPFYIVENPCRINGIGLCVVKRIVESFGGILRVETSLMGISYLVGLQKLQMADAG